MCRDQCWWWSPVTPSHCSPTNTLTTSNRQRLARCMQVQARTNKSPCDDNKQLNNDNSRSQQSIHAKSQSQLPQTLLRRLHPSTQTSSHFHVNKNPNNAVSQRASSPVITSSSSTFASSSSLACRSTFVSRHFPAILIHIIVISLLYSATAQAQITSQQSMCPKTCTCDDQTLETICKGSMKATGLPHTIHPFTRKLVINEGQISQYSSLDFLTRLKIIDLSDNKMVLHDFAAVSKNTELESINISYNLIAELKDTDNELLNDSGDAKRSQINIRNLYLEHNLITILKNFTFSRLHLLETLDLSSNLISSMESHSLFGLGSLKILNLKANQLLQVPTLALLNSVKTPTNNHAKYSYLRSLDLSENNFKYIEPDSFIKLEYLQDLYLESCSIDTIHERAFQGLHTLQSLTLNNNNIREVPSKSFSYIGLLRSLKLNSNKISYLEPDCFSSLVNLEELLLNNGTFSKLKRGTFNQLAALKRLEISYNPYLVKVEAGTFDNLIELNYLSLFHNSIRTIHNDFADKLLSLVILDIRANPLSCDCDLKWLTRWLRNFNETVIAINSTPRPHRQLESHVDQTKALLTDKLLAGELLNLTCAGPAALKAKLVIELPESKLDCLNPTSDLNVHIGFASLTLITFMIMFICIVNFYHNKKCLFVMLKDNLGQNNMSLMKPYAQDLHKNVDNMRKETQLYGSDYECVDYSSPLQTQPGRPFGPVFHGYEEYSQHI